MNDRELTYDYTKAHTTYVMKAMPLIGIYIRCTVEITQNSTIFQLLTMKLEYTQLQEIIR